MKIYAKVFALCLTAAAMAQPAYAHSDDYLDTVPGAHGGQLRMGGAYHFELVVSPTATADKASVVKVYLTDHAGVVAKNSGMKAQLLLKTNGKPVLVKLTADGENVLQGSAAFTASPELQATLAVSFADNSSAQMNFQPLKPKPAAEPHQHDDHDKTHDEQHEHNEPHKLEDAHSHH
jgi:hypothetical protein